MPWTAWRLHRTWKLAASVRVLCAFLALGLVLARQSADASPSGLNNIPTTDVVPPKVLVLQSWTNLTDDGHPELFVAFKFGVFKGLEAGVDQKANGDPHGHATFQAKYAFDILQSAPWRGVVGIANVSDHRTHQGEAFPYVATSYDFGVLRAHLGYSCQKHNEAFFGGLDRTVVLLGRDLQLKADVTQVNNSANTLYSAGFLYNFRPRADNGGPDQPGAANVLHALLRSIILESWVSKRSASSAETLTVKLNYVIEF